MSQDHSRDLIERIRHRCQQTASDAQHLELHQRWLVEPEEDYNGWYIPERRSFIALTTGLDGQEPSLAFPPATEQQLVETEQRLGFSLPPLLRLLYAQIANGGFGPGYGIVGASGGFDTSMVGEGITPSTANPEPCLSVSDHTAPQCMVNCE